MKSLKALRKELGMSQHDLSQFLGISRSHLAMSENGHRKLDSLTLIRLAHVDELTCEKKPGAGEIPVPASDKMIEFKERILFQKQKCLYRIAILERKLSRMRSTYEQASKQLHVFEFLLNEGVIEHQNWLRYKITKVTRLMYASGEAYQEQISNKIRILRAEEKELIGYLK